MTVPGCWMKASSVGAGGAVTSRAQVDSNKEATERTAARNSRAAIARAGVEGWAMARSQRHLERSEEHTSELQSLAYLVCRLLLEKKKKKNKETEERARCIINKDTLD